MQGNVTGLHQNLVSLNFLISERRSYQFILLSGQVDMFF